MVGAATLEPPKSGRSRFSKALPPPPSLPALDFDASFDLSPLASEKALPQPHPAGPLPPVPPPKGEVRTTRETTMAAAAKPPDSPLPSLPPKLTGPPLRSIPRRPVAAPVASTSTLSPNPSPAAAFPSPLPSPGGVSISSLLSAYSDHADDEPLSAPTGSPDGVLDSRGGYSVVSPSVDAQKGSTEAGSPTRGLPPLPSDRVTQKQEPGGRAFGGDDKELPPPPPPLKDSRRSFDRPRTPPDLQQPVTQPSGSIDAGSPEHGKGSPQQGELWRRRSLKANKILAVPGLELVSRHGSAAASAQNASQSSRSGQGSLESQAVPQPPLEDKPELPRSAPAQQAPPCGANGGLPGRTIRPIRSEEPVAQGGGSMGRGGSRFKKDLESANRGRGREEESSSQGAAGPAVTLSSTASATVPSGSAARLPTSEHGINNVHSPPPDTAASSSASSPRLAGQTKPIARKAVGASGTQLRHATSSQSLAPGPDGTGLGVRSPAGLPMSPRPDVGQIQKTTQILPVSPAPERASTSSPKHYVPYSPPADGDKASDPARPAAPSPQSDEVPRWSAEASSGNTSTRSAARETPSPQDAARAPIRPRASPETEPIETAKPRQRYEIPPVPVGSPPSADPVPIPGGGELSPVREPDADEADDYTDHPGAARFPRGWYRPLPADAIPDARPLTQRHHGCLTRHRYMTANRQRANPVACRTCGHKDRNAECYICSACSLNVCPGCVALLRRHKGDLRAVLDEVEKGKSEAGEGEQGSEGNAGRLL
ncbi:hypothetical protein VTH06DRAFT_3801 [Thermothelomyces fergusii]